MTNPVLGSVGLALIGVIAYRLLRGDLSLSEAAVRALFVLVVLLVVERVLLPVARLLVGSANRHDPPAG